MSSFVNQFSAKAEDLMRQRLECLKRGDHIEAARLYAESKVFIILSVKMKRAIQEDAR